MYQTKKYIGFYLGTASEGLKKLQENRRQRWRNKPPSQDALDDLLSLDRKETAEAELKLKAKAGPSHDPDPMFDALVSSNEEVDNTRTSPQRPVLPYDVAHPPSPRVSKGPNVKKSKEVDKLKKKLSSSEMSSDVEIPLSGVVRRNNAVESSELYSGIEHSNVSTEDRGR